MPKIFCFLVFLSVAATAAPLTLSTFCSIDTDTDGNPIVATGSQPCELTGLPYASATASGQYSLLDNGVEGSTYTRAEAKAYRQGDAMSPDVLLSAAADSSVQVRVPLSTPGQQRAGIMKYYYQISASATDYGRASVLVSAGDFVVLLEQSSHNSYSDWTENEAGIDFSLGMPFDFTIEVLSIARVKRPHWSNFGEAFADFGLRLYEADGITPVSLTQMDAVVENPEPGTFVLAGVALVLLVNRHLRRSAALRGATGSCSGRQSPGMRTAQLRTAGERNPTTPPLG